jgi:anti-anti-sigma regulatory factor
MFLPTFADVDMVRRARLVLLVVLTFLGVGIVLGASALTVPIMRPVLPLAIGFGLAMCVLLATLRLGYVRTASAGLIAAMIVIRLVVSSVPALTALPDIEMTLVLDSAITILLTGFLFTWWSTLPVALILVIGQILVGRLNDSSLLHGGMLTAATLLSFCVFVSLFARSLERALSYARQQEAAAQAAVTESQTLNQELATTLHDTQSLLDQERTLRDTISQLTVPIQEVGDGVLFAPLIGHIDTQRGEQISKAVLDQVHALRAHTLIIDVQGVSVIDSGVVALLDRLIRAVQLLGARVMMTGISAAMAATMTRLGMMFRKVTLHANVAAALHMATAHSSGSGQPPLAILHSANGSHQR